VEKRILIVEVNWLGDVLFSTPLIRAIREKFKNAYIACLTHPRTKEILEGNPRINEIIIYDEDACHKSLLGKLRLILLLRKKRFDLAVILHRSTTRALIMRFAGIKERVGYVTNKGTRLLTLPVDVPEEALHKVEYFLRIAAYLGCDVSQKNYEFFITEKERKYIEETLASAGIKKEDFVVVLNPGGNWLPKRWPEERFACLADELIKRHDAKIIISGAERDLPLAGRVSKKMKLSPLILCGKTNLKQFGALAQRANFVISGDSGPMHIAVAMKTGTVALFGPTSPQLTGPYGGDNYRVIQKNVGCEVPCYDLTCSDYRCMQAITVDDVLKVFEEMHE